MIRMTLADVAAAVGAPAPGIDAAIAGVTTDSREVAPGMLFAAIAGSRVDGHDFAARAMANGAVAVLAERPVDGVAPMLVVDDVLVALGRLAGAWRRQCDPLTIGITGSNGKTTVKEMVAAICRRVGPTLVTGGNYNNELGVPLTLFRLESRHRYAVLEMGAAKAGDIAYLCSIGQPDIGLVNNVGPAHLEGFGNESGVARAKGEMFEALPKAGTAVINNDESWASLWLEMNQADRVITFGHNKRADVTLARATRTPRVETPSGDFDLELALPGAHNEANALAATAIALAAGIDLDDIRRGLAAVQPVSGRLDRRPGRDGWRVIDDTYNANPASLYAALQVLTGEPGEAWLVLGDMLELGEDGRKLHAEMGEAARSLGVSRVYGIGALTRATVDAFGRGGRHYDDLDTLIESLSADLHGDVACLVKGSRSMGMEQVVAAISAPDEQGEAA